MQRESLSGSSGFITGADHFDFIVKRMKGQPTYELQNWKEHIDGSDDKCRQTVKSIEERVRI